MARVTRLSRWTYILMPENHGIQEQELVKSLRTYCRLALTYGLHPVCPALWYRVLCTPAELSQFMRVEGPKALERCDRIWLHQPLCEDLLRLDNFSFRLLSNNNRSKKPRPVYGLKAREEDAVRYHEPVKWDRRQVDEALILNLDTGLIRGI